MYLLERIQKRAGDDSSSVGSKKAKKEKAFAIKGSSYGIGEKGAHIKRLNHRHQEFVSRYIAYEWDAIKAYHEVYKCALSTATIRGPKLASEPIILAEIQKVWKPMLEDVEGDLSYLAKKIYNFTRGNVLDYFKPLTTVEVPLVDEGGNPLYTQSGDPRIADIKQKLIFKDLHSLPLWMQQNIKEIEIIPTEFGDHIKLKIFDSQKATMDIAKHLGVFSNLEDDGNLNSLKTKLIQGAQRAVAAAIKRREEKEEKVINGELLS